MQVARIFLNEGDSQYCEWRSLELFSQPFHSVMGSSSTGLQVGTLTIVWVFFSLFPSFILFPPCNQGVPNFHAIFEIWHNQVSNCDFMLVPRTQGNFITINLTNESVLTFLARYEKKVFKMLKWLPVNYLKISLLYTYLIMK